MNKELLALVREAEAQGWRVEQTHGGHYKWYPPDPSLSFVTSSTTPTGSNLRNHISLLKQRGFVPASERRATKVAAQREEQNDMGRSISPARAAAMNTRGERLSIAEEALGLVEELLDAQGRPLVLPGSVTSAQVKDWIMDTVNGNVGVIADILESRFGTVLENQDKVINQTSASVLTLETLINEVADQFKQHRDLYVKDVPKLKSDVRELERKQEAAKSLTVPEIEAVMREYVANQRRQIEAVAQAAITKLEETVVELIESSRTEMIDKINAAKEAAEEAALAENPLEALRRRMGGK